MLQEGRLYRLLDVGRMLVGTLEPEGVLSRVLETAREVTGARYAALGVLDERRPELARFLTRGVDEQTRREIGDLPRGHGILGLLIQDPRPLRLTDIGRHPKSFGFPPGHPPMRTFLGAPIMVRGEAWGNIYLSEKEGDEAFDASDESALVILAEWAALAIDNARLYQAAEDGRGKLERSVQELGAMADIAQAVAGETELQRVLELIAKRGRALVEAQAMVIQLSEGEELAVAAVAGSAPKKLEGTRLAREGTMGGEVVRTGRAHRVSDLESRGLRLGLEEHGLQPGGGLLVPLIFRGRAVGVLGAFDRATDGPDFNARDERLLLGFATSAGAAVVTAQSVARDLLERSVATAEEERRRWARELHDETLQDLAGLQLLLSSIRRDGDPAAIKSSVEGALEQVSTSMDKLRHLVAELRPAALEELGLKAAIEGLAEDVPGATVRCRLELAHETGREPTRLTPEIEAAAYRLTQEALTNVAKHSGAGSVVVELVEGLGTLELSVHDDGEGFDPEADTAGLGLLGMHERVAVVGGSLAVESRPGAGTRIVARIPALHVDGGPPLPRRSSR